MQQLWPAADPAAQSYGTGGGRMLRLVTPCGRERKKEDGWGCETRPPAHSTSILYTRHERAIHPWQASRGAVCQVMSVGMPMCTNGVSRES